VIRLLAVVAVACAALVVSVAPAAATNECRGLMVCVPVAGPWVVVPIGSGPARPSVEYQLSCPKGFVVGGLDAELSDRRIDVHFQATLGSPVNPGISTSRAAVFVATYVGPGAPAPSFRPHLGCLPATGGGVRVPTAAVAFPVGQPTVRHVKDVPLVPGAQRVLQSCAAGEVLVGASHAIGFYMVDAPSPAVVRQVRAIRTVRTDTVVADVRSGSAVRTIRAVVQVGALCAGGR
jgi:hypothetical protein